MPTASPAPVRRKAVRVWQRVCARQRMKRPVTWDLRCGASDRVCSGSGRVRWDGVGWGGLHRASDIGQRRLRYSTVRRTVRHGEPATISWPTHVDLDVAVELIRPRKPPSASRVVAHKGPLARVCSNVGCQVIRSAEAAVADGALERLDPRVLAVVPRQLVRPRKPLPAAVKGAEKRLLASVGPEVRLEVRPLHIRLVAPIVRTFVGPRLSSRGRCWHRNPTVRWGGPDSVGGSGDRRGESHGSGDGQRLRGRCKQGPGPQPRGRRQGGRLMMNHRYIRRDNRFVRLNGGS